MMAGQYRSGRHEYKIRNEDFQNFNIKESQRQASVKNYSFLLNIFSKYNYFNCNIRKFVFLAFKHKVLIRQLIPRSSFLSIY